MVGRKSSALYPTLSWKNFFNLLFPTFFLCHKNKTTTWQFAPSQLILRRFSSLFFLFSPADFPPPERIAQTLCYSISILCALLIVYETFPKCPRSSFGHCRWHFYPSHSTQHFLSKSFVQFITNATSCVRKSTQVSATSAKKADYVEWSVEWREKELVAFVIMP